MRRWGMVLVLLGSGLLGCELGSPRTTEASNMHTALQGRPAPVSEKTAAEDKAAEDKAAEDEAAEDEAAVQQLWEGRYQARSVGGAVYVLELEPSPVAGLEGTLAVQGVRGGGYTLRIQAIRLPGSGDLQVLNLGVIQGQAPWVGAGPDADIPLFVLGMRDDGLLATELGVLPVEGALSFWRR